LVVLELNIKIIYNTTEILNNVNNEVFKSIVNASVKNNVKIYA